MKYCTSFTVGKLCFTEIVHTFMKTNIVMIQLLIMVVKTWKNYSED